MANASTRRKRRRKDTSCTERSYGTFYRTVPLPDGVKAELAKASLHDGVLEITMPMTNVEEKIRTLEITEPVPEKTVKAA
ncbi:MAG: Hsp20/alpha crystallin family protein [Vicinamibacterales bacterium]